MTLNFFGGGVIESFCVAQAVLELMVLAQAILELMIPLPQLHEYWNDSCEPPYVVGIYSSSLKPKHPRTPSNSYQRAQQTARNGCGESSGTHWFPVVKKKPRELRVDT